MSAGGSPGGAGGRETGSSAAGLTPTAGSAGAVIGLLGPTAVGKTAVAAAVAAALGTRVISCDSMQVYRGFPVLTNQPGPDDTRGVEHGLVGFLEPLATFSAAEYGVRARELMAADVERAGVALLAGGTGLYLRAALAPLAVAPSDPEVRAALEARAAAEGAEVLHAELAGLDPAAAEAVDLRNVRRVVRALEAVLVGGREWSGRSDLWEPQFERPTLVVGLTLDRALLYPRIDARAGRMLREGAVDEVIRFREEYGLEATVPGGPGIRSAIGYGGICRYLDGEISRETAAELMAAATRQYARRQLTWLRRLQQPVGGAVMIDVEDRDPGDIACEILGLLKGIQ